MERRTSICAARWKTLSGLKPSIASKHRLGVGDVELGDARARVQRARQVVALAAGEVVEHQDLVPPRG